MRTLGRIRSAIRDAVAGFGTWQAEIPDQGRVVLVGLVLGAAAFLAAGSLPLALGMPAGVLVIIGLGIDFRDRRVALVLIPAIALVLIVTGLLGRP